MHICPYCTSANRQDAQFCNTCGRSLPGPSVLCSRCQALVTRADKFCHNCGARLSEVGYRLHTLPSSPAEMESETTPNEIGLGGGTFVDIAATREGVPPATAAPSIPHRAEGSWQLIDSWIAKQTQPSEPEGTPQKLASDADFAAEPSEIERVAPGPHHADVHEASADLQPPDIWPLGGIAQGMPQPASVRGHGTRNRTIGVIGILLVVAAVILWLSQR